MDRRLELDQILRKILESDNVYFQPPENVKMKYPAIVYSREDLDDMHANNRFYHGYTVYNIIVIGLDPDSEVIEKVRRLPMCRYDRYYASDNLNHDSFILYY